MSGLRLWASRHHHAVEQLEHIAPGDFVDKSAAPPRQHMQIQQPLGFFCRARPICFLAMPLNELFRDGFDAVHLSGASLRFLVARVAALSSSP